MGFADLLLADSTGMLNEKQRLYVNNIRAGSRRMLSLLSSKEDGTASETSSCLSKPLDETTQM
jgi:hypothetical protein